MVNVITKPFNSWSTQDIKNELLNMVKGRDTEPLSAKVNFYKNELLPYFEELSQRNPFPIVEDQLPIVLGVWVPIWSTIPFHDNLPGRIVSSLIKFFTTMVITLILLVMHQGMNLLSGKRFRQGCQLTTLW
ncbi:hypothetical protein [Scytonema sp. PRP1]|uniref:hypothetical protein n=1 Tax=Scytonema sp. PRP1 TaxID=3120513 RepID=UPI002FCFA375